MIVRDARPEDMVAVQAIYASEVLRGLASFEEVPPGTPVMEARRQAVVALGLPWLVAERDDHVAGYAYASSYRPRPAYRYAVECSVYVDAAARGLGVARTLMSELIARCERDGWRQMIAVIGDSGNVASIGLHAAMGFRNVGTLEAVGFKFGRWVDSVLMQRALGAGASTGP
ncbi:GNAT family N-acetyltransferase [Palleronia sp.]|uniref:GNAT family N-acetyltransferase n=1 Tax=Palleronia sp. TaxID=1940284 RepID=UPI0035C7BC52